MIVLFYCSRTDIWFCLGYLSWLMLLHVSLDLFSFGLCRDVGSCNSAMSTENYWKTKSFDLFFSIQYLLGQPQWLGRTSWISTKAMDETCGVFEIFGRKQHNERPTIFLSQKRTAIINGNVCLEVVVRSFFHVGMTGPASSDGFFSWRGILTFLFFPMLVSLAFAADKGDGFFKVQFWQWTIFRKGPWRKQRYVCTAVNPKCFQYIYVDVLWHVTSIVNIYIYIYILYTFVYIWIHL